MHTVRIRIKKQNTGEPAGSSGEQQRTEVPEAGEPAAVIAGTEEMPGAGAAGAAPPFAKIGSHHLELKDRQNASPVRPSLKSSSDSAVLTASQTCRNSGQLQDLKKYISGGHYSVREQISKGAESVLYSARCQGRTYCVKSIRNFIHRIFGDLRTRNDSPKLTKVKYSTKCRHIRNEYRISQMLDPGRCNGSVIQIYGLRKTRFLIFETGYDLIMDYVEGTDLSDRERLSRLSLEEKIDIIIQCTQALNYFHRHHLIHLDIKPSNFMLTPDLRVVLIDFGVSVTSGTRPRSVTGTAGYLSPEQICRQPLNTDTDLFALGMTFAVLFGGSPLLQDLDTIRKKDYRSEVESNLRNAAVPAIESIPDLMDCPALAEVIRKCTIMKREQRISSCRQLLLNIRAACREDGVRLLKPERLDNLLSL